MVSGYYVSIHEVSRTTEVLTDGGECGLGDLVAIERFVAPDDNPVERITNVAPIPVLTIRAPP